MSASDLPASEDGTRENVEELLETKLEVKIGEGKIKRIKLSPDMMKAYVELKDVADINKVLTCEVTLGNDRLIIESFDLMQVWIPYLIVKGLEFDGMDNIEELLKVHFEALADGAKIESVDVKGTEAKILFVNPKDAMKFQEGSADFLGLTLDLIVEFYFSEQKTTVLAVKGLPQKLSEDACKRALISHFSRHSKFKATDCFIHQSVAYLTFEDKSAVKTIVANPPTANFYGGTTLELSEAAIPQKEGSSLKEPSLVSDDKFDNAHGDFNSSGILRKLSESTTSTISMQPEASPGRSEGDYPSKTTKVLITDVPSDKNAFAIECYLGMLMHAECIVKQYGKQFMAIFYQPIDFQKLKDKSSAKPLETSQLSFHLLNPASAILITTDNELLLNEPLLKMHFEKFVNGSVYAKVFPDKAHVYFGDPQSVERIMDNSECHVINNSQLNLTEYYDFMEDSDGNAEEDSDDGFVTPPPPSYESRWKNMNVVIDDFKDFWQPDHILQELNRELGPLNAHAIKSSDQLGALQLIIEPLSGSETMTDWDQLVMKVVDNFRRNYFKMDSRTIPNYGFDDLIKYAKSAGSPKVKVQVAGSLVTLTGEAIAVTDVISTIDAMIHQLFEIKSEQRNFSRRRIKYLKKFCIPQLQNTKIPIENVTFDDDEQTITVQAQQEARELFWEAVHTEIKEIQEKTIDLESEAYELLATEQGAKKIEEMIGMQAVYDLVRNPQNTLYLLSTPTIAKGKLKAIKKSLKKLIDGSKELKINSLQKFRFCKDVNWKEFVDKLQSEMFVLITVDESNQSVKFTGKQAIVDRANGKVKAYLSEQGSIEEHIRITGPKWTVISQSYWDDLEAIKKNFQVPNIDVKWPKPGVTNAQTNPLIIVKGDPPLVDSIKGMLEALQRKVCEKEEIISNIPASILGSIQETILSLQHKFCASIEVSKKNDEFALRPTAMPLKRMAAPKLCSATCSNGVRISVYAGDFTQHGNVDVIINFIPPSPTNQEGNLRLLFDAGGIGLQQDFRKKIDQFLYESPGEMFISNPGQLQCSKLCHCMISTWDGNVTRYLESSLSKTVGILKCCTTVLFTSICSNPLNYPAEVYARNIVSLLSTNEDISSELTAAIYVNEVAQAATFEQQLRKNNCHILSKVPSSVTKGSKMPQAQSIHDPISSYITLTKGSLLDIQADVYINSTNSSLNLNVGILSKIFLKTCGEQLQKECSKHAPLKPEAVAVTKANNLKASYIYHVALPDYKQEFDAKEIFRGTIQAVLSTARDKGVQSLAIPSLGVGNLCYPAEVSAKLLFEEIIAFHCRNPNSNMKFHFVIFDQSVYQEFSKVYNAQKISSAPAMLTSVEKKSEVQCKRPSGSTQLSIVNADISEIETDIIVNTTTQDMNLSYTAVGKALLKKAGPMLQTTCDQMVQNGLRLDHGQIVATKTFGSLQCKKIIHAYLPTHDEAKAGNLDHFPIITEIVKNCLDEAEKSKMKSISFPAFGFGQGGYSVHEVAEPMLTAFRDFGRQNPQSVEIIKIAIFDQENHKQFYDFFVKFFQIEVPISTKFLSFFGASGGCDRSVELQDSSMGQLYGQIDTNSLLSFRIFADSDKKCDEIAKALRDSIKKKSIEEKIEKPKKVISNLIDADIEDIETIGKRQQVQIHILREIGKIEIFGEMNRVKEAKIQIIDVINEIERTTESELKFCKWQSEDDYDIEPYNDSDSFKLERALARKVPNIEMVIDTIEVTINLIEMKEINKDSGTTRKVTRVTMKFPDTWAPQPEDANGKEETIHMFDVPEGSTEYKEVLDRFYEKTDSSTVTIVSLKRVQNPNEYRRHMAFSEAIGRKYHKKRIDVRRLFHGCAEKSVQPIAVQGFNRNFAASANAAVFGKGVYFALHSDYSARTQYSVPNKDGHQFIFVCHVIVGEFTEGKQEMNMAPPLKKGSIEVYDALVNKKDDPTIFVALTDAQAYPEYLITFKKKIGNFS